MSEEYQEPTPEQKAAFEAKRAEMLIFWEQEIPKLEIEFNYSNLQANIEKARVDAWTYRIRLAQMMAPPPEKDPEPLSKKEPTVPS